MRYKITKAITGLVATTFGAALFTLPALLGLFYHDIPHAWVLLVLLALAGASCYYHSWKKVMRKVEARTAIKVDLDKIAHIYGMTRKAGESDAELRTLIMEAVKGMAGRE